VNALSLVGTWALESWESVGSSGEVDEPFGKMPVGYITYTADGYISDALMSAGRKAFVATTPTLIKGKMQTRHLAWKRVRG
jgi:hypothetical protein